MASNTLSEKLKKLEELKKSVRDAERGIVRMRKRMNGIVEKIATAIRDGDITDDRFINFGYARYRSADGEIISAYRALENSLSGKMGEAVLVIHKYREQMIFGDPMMDPRMRDAEKYILGVLQDTELVLPSDGKRCELPTGRYIAFESLSKMDDPAEGNIAIELHPGREACFEFDYVLKRTPYTHNGVWCPQAVIAGNDFVAQYLRSKSFSTASSCVIAYYWVMQKLGVDVSTPEIEEELARQREELKKDFDIAIGNFYTLKGKGVTPSSKEMLELKAGIEKLKGRACKLHMPIHALEHNLLEIEGYFAKAG